MLARIEIRFRIAHGGPVGRVGPAIEPCVVNAVAALIAGVDVVVGFEVVDEQEVLPELQTGRDRAVGVVLVHAQKTARRPIARLGGD
jgi:hypothetical protein